MSKKKAAVPNAWDDDDWETQADKLAALPPPEELEVKLSRAERKAKHDEANKQIWDAADAPERPLFLQARDDVPLKGNFKPAVKVLSRKPPPKVVSHANPTSRVANLNTEDDDDSEEEERKRAEKSFLERQALSKIEREEKQRKYQEARERILGGSSNDADGRPSSANDIGSRNSSRGRGRGGKAAGTPSADQSPARTNNHRKLLYDPSYASKPNSIFLQKREASEIGGTSTSTSSEYKPVRSPRGPDGSGRGGFGFAARGDRTGASF